MDYPPPRHPIPRPPRVRPADAPPAVLRAKDGTCTSGRLEVVSVTGGLLSMARPQQQRTIAQLMFVTERGPVMAPVEMLPALSWAQQPFRFLQASQADQIRLRRAIEDWSARANSPRVVNPNGGGGSC
jgi:hypothetical protein